MFHLLVQIRLVTLQFRRISLRPGLCLATHNGLSNNGFLYYYGQWSATCPDFKSDFSLRWLVLGLSNLDQTVKKSLSETHFSQPFSHNLSLSASRSAFFSLLDNGPSTVLTCMWRSALCYMFHFAGILFCARCWRPLENRKINRELPD